MARFFATGFFREEAGYLAGWLLFYCSRLLVLYHHQPQHSDIHFYSRYVQVYQVAVQTERSFYDVHQDVVQKQEQGLFQSHTSLVSDEYQLVAYPPLAVAMTVLPSLWIKNLPSDGSLPSPFFEEYVAAFRLQMFVFDVVLFATLFSLVEQLFPSESALRKLERMLAYILGTSLLWPLLYDRLEIVTVALIVLSFWFLVQGWNIVALVVLGLAIDFKVMPLVLAPCFILATVRALFLREVRSPGGLSRLLFCLANRIVVILIATIGLALVLFCWQGAGTLDYLTFHQLRGLEVESLYSSLMMGLSLFGLDVEVYNGYGSTNLRSAISEFLTGAAPWVWAFASGAALVLFVAACFRLADRRAGQSEERFSLAQMFPQEMAGYVLLFLLIALITNKVISGHFLFWVLPFVCLISFPGLLRRILLWSFVLTCALTTLIYPFLWREIAVGKPTVLGIFVLGARNLWLFAACCLLGVGLWKYVLLKEVAPKLESSLP